MKIFECKCGSKEIFIKNSGNNKGLYCADCGKWIQWLGKDDLRLAERQIEQSIVNPIPRNLDELKEHNKQIRTDAIEEFAHTLKETFNNEFPSNYHCTQPYFTLDNVRVLIDCVVKEQKK